MKKLIIALVILATFGLFGCVSSVHNPTDLYDKLNTKFKNLDNVKVSYDMNISVGIENFEASLVYTKLNQNSKLGFLASFMGETNAEVEYRINGTNISCSEYDRKLYCDIKSGNDNIFTFWNIIYPQINNQTKISLVGTRNIIGRSCYDFKINNASLPTFFTEEMAAGISAENLNSTFEICLDKETGTPLFVDVKYTYSSKIIDKVKTIHVFTVKATDISFDVTDKDLEIPVDFVVDNISCDTNYLKIDITPFNKFDYLNLSESINKTIQTKDLKLYKENSIEIPVTFDYGSHFIKICSNNYCKREFCYVSNQLKRISSTNVSGSVEIEKTIPELSSQNLIKNGDFSDRLSYWSIKHSSNVDDTWNITVINDGDRSNVLKFERKNSREDGGSVYAVQKINKDVSNYSDLKLEMSLKVISHDLEGGGGWSGSGEFPVHVFIYYLDNQNQTHFWSWGFTTEEANYNDYSIVQYDKWYHFTSGNLMNLSPKPVKITEIKVGGNGWDFNGEVDDIELVQSNRKV